MHHQTAVTANKNQTRCPRKTCLMHQTAVTAKGRRPTGFWREPNLLSSLITLRSPRSRIAQFDQNASNQDAAELFGHLCLKQRNLHFSLNSPFWLISLLKISKCPTKIWTFWLIVTSLDINFYLYHAQRMQCLWCWRWNGGSFSSENVAQYFHHVARVAKCCNLSQQCGIIQVWTHCFDCF